MATLGTHSDGTTAMVVDVPADSVGMYFMTDVSAGTTVVVTPSQGTNDLSAAAIAWSERLTAMSDEHFSFSLLAKQFELSSSSNEGVVGTL